MLLEVMIAMFLILLCAVPTLTLFVDTYLAQKHSMRIYERDRVAEQVHAHIVEQFYKGEMDIESLLSGPVTEHPLGNSDCEAALQKLGFYCKCTLKIIHGDHALDRHKHLHYLCQLDIEMTDLREQDPKLAQGAEYQYIIYIDRGKRDKSHPHYQKQKTSP